MAVKHEEAFRSVIDQAIQAQVRNNKAQKHSWPGHRTHVTAGGLILERLAPTDGAPAGPFEGRLWYASPEEEMRNELFQGRIAIISFSERPGLFRHWTINTALDTPVKSWTMRQLEETEVDGIIDWVHVPHVYKENLVAAGQLTAEEVGAATEVLQREAEVASQNDEALQNMARTRRQAAM